MLQLLRMPPLSKLLKVQCILADNLEEMTFAL